MKHILCPTQFLCNITVPQLNRRQQMCQTCYIMNLFHNLHFSCVGSINEMYTGHPSLAMLWYQGSHCWLLVTANVVPSSLVLSNLMTMVICCSETSVLTIATWCHIPEYGILHSHLHENLKCYRALTGWAL
jgi:hypothetical protein